MMSIKKSQAILKCFINLKKLKAFGLRWAQQTKPTCHFCDTQNFFQLDCETLNEQPKKKKIKREKTPTLTRTGNFLLTSLDWDCTRRYCYRDATRTNVFCKDMTQTISLVRIHGAFPNGITKI